MFFYYYYFFTKNIHAPSETPFNSITKTPFLRQGQIWSLGLKYGKKVKLDFSDSFVACDIKVDLCNHLNELL